MIDGRTLAAHQAGRAAGCLFLALASGAIASGLIYAALDWLF